MDDNFELEVTDLRTGAHLPSPLASVSASASAATNTSPLLEAEGADTLELTAESLRSADSRPPPRLPSLPRDQARRLRALLAGGVTLLIFAGVLFSLPGIQPSLGALLRAATPTAAGPLLAGAEAIYFVDGVPWGMLHVDGRVASIPTLDQGPPTLTLGRGRHSLDYHADPFRRVRCTISVPAADSDTCPLRRDSFGSSDLGADVRVIDLGATLEALPDDQRFDLMKAVSSALANIRNSATVASGDHYIGPRGAIAVAKGSLSAALNFSLNASPMREGTSIDLPPDCITLCSFDLNTDTPDGGWYVQAHALMHWEFTAAQGTISVGNDVDVAYGLSVRWDGFWLVKSFDDNAVSLRVCELAVALLPGGETHAGFEARGGMYLTDGCLVTVQNDAGAGTPTPVTALLLYRFGVLLAANAAAQQLFPSLTVASAHERALAQQWQVSS